MALMNRVSQLFKADFNAVLDHIEEPEQLLKQAVRDMEDELAASERRIAACKQEQEALEVRGRDIQDSVRDLDEQLDLCFQSGKDDLARSIIRKKLEAGRLLKRLDGKLETNRRYLEKERAQLEENRATLDGLRQKAELFVSRTPAEASGDGTDEFARMSRELSVSEDEIEIAFLREKSARSES